MRRGDLDDLEAFAAVAQARSFSRAAARLGLSPSALSHAMRALEARLGVRLLARTTRSVAPTEAGARLLQSLAPALADIAAGLADLADGGERIAGSLRITTFAYPAKTVLEPKLPGFLLRHPEVRVEVNVDSSLTDIVGGGFDAGIRFGDTVARDMIAVRVGPDLRTVVVATPDYFSRRPPPETPADLAAHDCVGHRLATSGGLLKWEFERDGRAVNVRAAGSLVVDDGGLAEAAVRAGAGLGYLLEDQVAADLASGRLVQVLADWCPRFTGCHLYHPSRRQTPSALKALIETLRAPSTAGRATTMRQEHA